MLPSVPCRNSGGGILRGNGRESSDADLKRKGFEGITLPPGSYELHKINGVRLDINKSLDELGVQDGDTLVLVPRVAGESFEPQYESLSTGLAAMGKWLGRDGGDRMFAPVTPLTAAHTAIAIIAMAAGVVVALTLRARTFTDNPVPAAVAGGFVVAGDRDIRRPVGLAGAPRPVQRVRLAGRGVVGRRGACAPPGALGAAHGLIGLVIVILRAIAIGAMTWKRWQTAAVTAVVTVCGILAAVAVVRMFGPASAQVVAVCALVGLLILVRMTPLIALWVARVRPPHFGSITGRDLFARREGMPVDTVSPVSEDESEDEDNELTDITARGAAIAASARLVNAVQVGVCVGVSIVLPAAVWGVLAPGRPWAWLALVVAGLVVSIFITQGRGFAAKYQAVALACGAAAAVCAGVVKYAITEPKNVGRGIALARGGRGGLRRIRVGRSASGTNGAVQALHPVDRGMGGSAGVHRLAASSGGPGRAVHVDSPLKRVAAVTAALTMVALSVNIPAAQAITPPHVDPGLVPPDGPPRPDQPMRRANSCSTPITVRNPDVAQLAPGFNLLNISKAWQYSTGNGVPVAVIDTGISPNPRLPAVPGGDYIMGEDGLSDCDAHGTIVGSIIAAAPQGVLPMPRPMPSTPGRSRRRPGRRRPTARRRRRSRSRRRAPPPPPPPVTITQVLPPPPPPPPPPEGEGATAISNGPADPQTEDEPRCPRFRRERPTGWWGWPRTRPSSRSASRPGLLSRSTRRRGIPIRREGQGRHAQHGGARGGPRGEHGCEGDQHFGHRVPAGGGPRRPARAGRGPRYAATVKDAVVVAAAGNDGEAGCNNNPMYDPLDPSDPRDWHQVKVVSSPSWFSDYVLSVGAVDATGAALDKSMSGPWVGVAAPGTHIMGLSPQGGGPVNAYPPSRPGEKNMPFWGTSFSAAYVSGVAALVRAKFPDLSAHQVINRIVQSAHNPPAGVDNKVGYGLVDPVAALTFNIPPGDRVSPGAQSRVIRPAPPPPPPDHRARNIAIGFLGAVAAGVLVAAIAARLRRAR